MRAFLSLPCKLACAACVAAATGLAGATDNAIGQIVRVDGTAMVSDGARYVEAPEGRALYPRDRVLVMEDSSAVLQFADGCEYRMSGSELLTIGAGSACAERQELAGAPPSRAAESGILDNTAAGLAKQRFAAVEQGASGQLGGRDDDDDDDRLGLWIIAAGGLGAAIWAGTNDTNRGSGGRSVQSTPSP
jgi:hypothetical protein